MVVQDFKFFISFFKFFSKFFIRISRFNQHGVSTVLAIIILTGVLGLGLIASSLVLRESNSIRGIEQSEVAYYAAEAAAERRLYEYNKQLPGRATATAFTDTCTSLTNTLEVLNEAAWKETGLTLNMAPNNWVIDLNTNNFFELSMDLEGAPTNPPDTITVLRIGGGPVETLLLTIDKLTGDEDQDVIASAGNSVTIPASGNFDWANNYYRIKISELVGGATYHLTTNPGADDIVMNMVLDTCGQFRGANYERRLQTTHDKWEIY